MSESKDEKALALAAQRILDGSPVARLFDREIAPGRFIYNYDEPAHDYEELMAGRYVLTTSLDATQASTGQIVVAYRQLLGVEHRFRVLRTSSRSARSSTGPNNASAATSPSASPPS